MRDLNVHPDFYIPFEWRKPQNEYYDVVSSLLPISWRLRQDYFWTQAISTDDNKPVQGWKIHVSSRWGNEYNTLQKVIPLCVAHNTEFKFASDSKILKTLLGKNCTRSASGKFITIYPATTACFQTLIAALYDVLKHEDGPYILSDRPYKDAKVLFYRYGGFKSFDLKDNFNRSTACIINAAFQYTEDKRDAQFILPDFVSDPLLTDIASEASGQVDAEQPGTGLFDGRYHMQSVIKFSNAGGVYLANDVQRNETVIVKEARPYVGVDADEDCIARLHKEYRILQRLAASGIAPKAYGLFQEWQHWYLAQQIVTGQTLRSYQLQQCRIIHSHSTDQQMRDWIANSIKIAINCFKLIKTLHANGIIFGDLSLNNLMVCPDTLEVKLIDFEGACESGVDVAVNFYTPGFARSDRLSRDCVEYQDDIYALGCVLVAMFMPSSTLLNLKQDYAEVFFQALEHDIGLPPQYLQCVTYLLTDSSADLDPAINLLAAADVSAVHAVQLNTKVQHGEVQQMAASMVENILRYNQHHLELDRRDRILPLGPECQHALALDHGAAGVIYAWHHLTGQVPEALVQWFTLRLQQTTELLPGLLNGAAGVAWLLQDLNMPDRAERLLQQASLSRQLYRNMSLGYGAAGLGYSLLYRWHKTQDPLALSEACRIANVLMDTAVYRDGGAYWEQAESAAGVGVGLWEGGSGIALFLMYLYCATENEHYLALGKLALQADFNHGKSTQGSYGFVRRTNASILYPYLGYGTAGVATVVLRYHALTGEPAYRQFLDDIKPSVAAKYTVNSGLFSGISGLGNYLLDAYQFLQQEEYYFLACQAADALKVFAVEREEGLCFPANNRTKLSTDYADGSAGTALFLHRLNQLGTNFNFMLDPLLQAYQAQQSKH